VNFRYGPGVEAARVQHTVSELGWHDRWIETQLAHGDRNKVRSAYDHAKYLPQRRTMMQSWGDYVDALHAQLNVEPCHQVSEQAAIRAMDAFQYLESDHLCSFQAQAMQALQTILSLNGRTQRPGSLAPSGVLEKWCNLIS